MLTTTPDVAVQLPRVLVFFHVPGTPGPLDMQVNFMLLHVPAHIGFKIVPIGSAGSDGLLVGHRLGVSATQGCGNIAAEEHWMFPAPSTPETTCPGGQLA